MAGKPRGPEPKTHIASQRYTDSETVLLESVAGGCNVNQFIHDAAVDRARLFAERTEEVPIADI